MSDLGPGVLAIITLREAGEGRTAVQAEMAEGMAGEDFARMLRDVADAFENNAMQRVDLPADQTGEAGGELPS